MRHRVGLQRWRRATLWAVLNLAKNGLVAAIFLFGLEAVQADSVIAPPADVKDRVPAYLIEIPASVPDILIADTENAALLRFVRTPEGLEAQSSRYMSVGQKGVGKERAWDKKTPLGIYFITEELDTRRLAAKYGEAAFVLDYPNAWDVANERTGWGIWLHGVDPALDKRPTRDTDGCLALPNDALLSLSAHLSPQVTPVIIARQLDWSTAQEISELRAEFRAALEDWRRALEDDDLIAYLSLYDDAFKSGDMDRPTWVTFQSGVFGAREFDSVEVTDVLLLRDPEVDGLYLSRFSQTVRTANGPVTLRKRLYWRRSAAQWRIVSEGVG